MQWVFETLGIDKDADASTIRKAYARAIKQCDQATEAERFQRIRQAYEWALQWAKQQEKVANAPLEPPSPEPMADPVQDPGQGLPVRIVPKPVPLDENEVFARQVFEEFVDALAPGATALDSILAKYSQDIRLTALDAKAMFEQAVLVRAFSQPSDIKLLDAACDLFAWETSCRHLAPVRPDLVHRMQRQQTLRRLLMGNDAADGKELEDMVSIFALCQKNPKEKVEPWQIVNANKVIDRYASFKAELGERYGVQVLGWWHEKLRANTTLWSVYDEKRAQMAARPAARQQQRRTGGSSMGWLIIFPVFALMNVLSGLSPPSNQERANYEPPKRPVATLPVPPDPHRQEMDLLREKADKGDPEAENQLGEILKTGATGDQGYRTAADLFQKAADSGLAPAKYNLGIMYEDGLGVTRNLSTAAELIKQAADEGYAEAQFHLGVMYKEGRGVKINATLAHAWWEKAAKQGHLPAQFNLGLSFARGDGAKQDYTAAARWWRTAAMRGNANAQGGMGWLCEHGLGVPRDNDAAVVWFRNAASQGDMAGQIALASMYERGAGVRKDRVVAYALLSVASSRSESTTNRASIEMKRMEGELSKDQVNTAIELAGKLRSRNPFLARLDAAVRSGAAGNYSTY